MQFTKITVKINSSDKPPYFMGSQLRGAFGYALKNIYNEVDKKDSLFYDFYEKENSQRGFRFDYVLGQFNYEFSLYLFDEYCDECYFLVSAFHEMLTKIGLGKARKTYKNFEIFINDECIYENNNLTFIDDFKKDLNITNPKSSVNIEIKTPIRLKKNGVFIRKETDFEVKDIILSIYKRISFLKGEEIYSLPYKPSYEYRAKDVFFKDLSRFSQRKQSKMKLGGMMGSFELNNLDEESYKLLKIGEILGAGKETSFGLGKIIIREAND